MLAYFLSYVSVDSLFFIVFSLYVALFITLFFYANILLMPTPEPYQPSSIPPNWGVQIVRGPQNYVILVPKISFNTTNKSKDISDVFINPYSILTCNL